MSVGGQAPVLSRARRREQAIMAAALEILGEVGYERLTIDEVAARAQASKTTIYRRWPGKAKLVIAAMRVRLDTDAIHLAETGDLREDLLGLLRQIRMRFGGINRRLLIGLVNAAEHDAELADILRSDITRQKARVHDLLDRRAIVDGLGPVGSGLIGDVGPSAVIVRILVTGEPTDDDYLARLVDEILLPLLRATVRLQAGQESHPPGTENHTFRVREERS